MSATALRVAAGPRTGIKNALPGPQFWCRNGRSKTENAPEIGDEQLSINDLSWSDPGITYVLLPGKHALARKNSIALRDLAKDPMVLLDVKPSRDYFTSLLFRAGIEPDIRFRSPSFETVRALVGNGLGYSILGTRPHGDVTYDGRKLACIPIQDDVKASRIVLAHPARARQTRLVQVFSEFCVRHLSEADPPGRESGRKS